MNKLSEYICLCNCLVVLVIGSDLESAYNQREAFIGIVPIVRAKDVTMIQDNQGGQ